MENRNYHEIARNNYPLLLKYSKYCPKQLFAIGNTPPPSTCSDDKSGPVGIAMVGTRRPNNSANELCKRLVHSLKGTNAVIISGLAQGIDSLCHTAALEARLNTIAVLGQGVGTRIGGGRGELAERILKAGGALVSEFAPDEPAYKGNFPARNKIISGMSFATVIIQSKEKGGALITADFCHKEGKPLYAIPGDFDSDVSIGPNELLDRGIARPVFKPENLYKVLGLTKKGGLSLAELNSVGCNLSLEATRLFKKVNGFRKTFTELQSDFDFNTSELLAILTELEMAGLARTEDNFQFHFNGIV